MIAAETLGYGVNRALLDGKRSPNAGTVRRRRCGRPAVDLLVYRVAISRTGGVCASSTTWPGFDCPAVASTDMCVGFEENYPASHHAVVERTPLNIYDLVHNHVLATFRGDRELVVEESLLFLQEESFVDERIANNRVLTRDAEFATRVEARGRPFVITLRGVSVATFTATLTILGAGLLGAPVAVKPGSVVALLRSVKKLSPTEDDAWLLIADQANPYKGLMTVQDFVEAGGDVEGLGGLKAKKLIVECDDGRLRLVR